MSPNPDVGKSIEDKFKNKNLRTIWRKMKKTMLRNIDKFDKETESREGRDLRRKLDRGLGPLLDSWDRELKKFPKHDPQKVGSIGRRVERTIITYKKIFGTLYRTFISE